jgi:hypothetical protein
MLTNLPTGVIVMFAVAAFVSSVLHWRIKSYLLAAAASLVAAPAAFILVCTLQSGFPKDTTPRAFLIFALMALPFALLVGIPFVVYRHRRAAHVS